MANGTNANLAVEMTSPECQLEETLIGKLRDLKHEYRSDIRDCAALEQNFRDKFEALNAFTREARA